MILSAQTIRKYCSTPKGVATWFFPLVEPFHERQEIVWHPYLQEWLDVNPGDRSDDMQDQIERLGLKRFSFGLSACGYDVRLAQDIWLFPMFGRLASTLEYFHMTPHVMAEVKDKSSLARRFITVQNTVIEPGWRGFLTLELTNHRPWPVRLRKGMPIAQIVFKYLDDATEQPYNGKYQDQGAGPQPAR